MKSRFLLCLLLVLLGVTGCETGGQGSLKHSIANIQGGLQAYRNQYGSWPANLGTLQNFAVQRGRELDLSPFADLSIRRATASTVLVEYTTQPPESEKGGFSLSHYDIVNR